MYGHAATGWGEYLFSADDAQAPFRTRPDINPGSQFTSPVNNAGPQFTRSLNAGNVFVNGEDHTFGSNETVTATLTTTVQNVAPAVNAGPDAVFDEGGTFTGAGSFSDPGTLDTWAATVNYGDGSGDQALALIPDKSFALNHVYADDGTYTVTVTVSDDDGGVGSDTILVTVGNVAPTASISGPGDGVPGLSLDFTLGASDPSPTDQSAGFTYNVNWGDGNNDTINGPDGTLVSHTYLLPASYTVRMTATDKDSAISSMVTHAVTIALALELPDPQNLGETMVGVGAPSGGNDTIILDSGGVRVFMNGELVGTFHPTSRVLVFGQDGDDDIRVSGNSPFRCRSTAVRGTTVSRAAEETT